MFFNRKKKNRRVLRSNVLDVKLSSDRIRASRMRIVALALGLVFTTVFGFYLLWMTGSMLINHFVYQNSAFAIEQIDVQTDGILSSDQIRRWAGVKPGDNLMALELPRVKREIEMVSIIKSVAVERVLPHTLRLRISERDPIAEVHLYHARAEGGIESVVMQVDAGGNVMTIPDPRQLANPRSQSTNALPVLLGIDPSEMIPCRKITSVSVHAALELLTAFEHSPMAGLVDIQSIDTASPQILQVTTSHGSQISFSMADFDRQFRRWREIFDQAQHISKAIATLDLSVPNSIPATWAVIGTVPQSPAMNRHVPRNKGKRNV
jgi:cell division septal protein FtsQ